MDNLKKPKIIFYTCTARAFRTTLVGHLHEISKNFSVALLSEKLDDETEQILKSKEFFPNLEKIINIDQATYGFSGIFEKLNIFKKHKLLYKLVEKIIKEEKPDIVIVGSDVHSLFEIYLTNLAKKYGAINVVIQPTLLMGQAKKISKWFDLVFAYQMFSNKLPFFVRYFLVKIRKYIGHFIYFWIFPITLGKLPFWGSAGYILKKGNFGMRSANYCLIFSKRDYEICVKDGVNPKKLIILPHPMETNTKDFFNKAYFSKISKMSNRKLITLIMPDVEIGFSGKNNNIIPFERRVENWMDIAVLASKIFSDHDIVFKPHPNTGPFLEKLQEFLDQEKNEKIKIVNPKEPVDKYIEMSDIIIGLPMSASTVLFTAKLQNPNKKIISLDFYEELMGDCFKNFEGISYIKSFEEFEKELKEIRVTNLEYNLKDLNLKQNKVVEILFEILKEKKVYENTSNKRV